MFYVIILFIDLYISMLYLIQIWQVEVLAMAEVDHGRKVSLLDPQQHLQASVALHLAPPLQPPTLNLVNLTRMMSI